MSTVFYRWGAGRDESRVTFDGTHISVFDLKREIILGNRMGNGKDFDIAVYDNVTGEEFKDDDHQIPRSSSLIARRLPSSIKGRGNAQNYIVGTAAGESLTGDHRIEQHARDAMLAKQNRGVRGAGGTFGSLTKRFDGKEDKADQPAVAISTGNAEEDARIKQMFQQQEDQWEHDLDELSQQPRAAASFRQRQQRPGGAPGGGAPSKFDYSMPPDKEPPVGYICYRCGQKGHWIQNCPNNEDPAAQDRKRFVRVTGIPRSFLKTVETPIEGEGSSGGAMLTADGGFVRAVPDQRRWQQEVAAKPRTLTGQEVRDQEMMDGELKCPICKKVVWEAVRTPCCDTAYCEECITTHLVEHDFECPACESKVASLDKLKPDHELREKVKGYVDGEIERSKKEEQEEKEARGDQSPKAEEGEAEAEAGEVTNEGRDTNNTEDDKSSMPGIKFDPARMQEMLNPQTMQLYLTQINKMLQNPAISAHGRLILQNQMQAVNSTVLQMQMMAASGMMGNGMGMGMGMGMMPGMPMGNMNMNMPMGDMGNMGNMGNMNMNMGMSPMGNNGMNGMDNGMMMNGMNGNMGMNQGGGGQMGGGQMGGMRGRGGFNNRGGFRGRGNAGFNGPGRGGMQRPYGQQKRGADEAGMEIMAGGDKNARMG